jgi:hypothetical protein
LKLDRNNFNATPFLKAIEGLINPYTRLSVINFTGCNLLDKGGEAVFTTMLNNHSVSSMFISHNCLGVREIKCKINRILAQLLLEYCCKLLTPKLKL